MTTIKEDEWLTEMERLSQESRSRDGVGRTPAEWATQTGWTVKKVLSMIRVAMERGTLVRGTRLVECVNGRMSPVTTYSFLTQKKASASGLRGRATKARKAGS